MILRWLLVLVWSGAFARAAEPLAVSGPTMGTTWSASFIPPETPFDPKLVRREVQSRLDALEQIFSTYRAGSELMRFNASNGTEWIGVSEELAEVVRGALHLSAMTDGAFDPTVLPLVELWGFGAAMSRKTIPSLAEIDAVRGRVGWRRLEVRATPPALRKVDARIAADLSSIAKGFAADVVSDQLSRAGLANHLVRIGGDMKARGRGPTGKGWRVGFERADSATIADVTWLLDEAVSTSGNYRNFVVIDGQRFGHVIDPRTGRPVESSLACVSVVHGSSAMSSGLATALFAAGEEEGRRIAEREHVAALFIVREGAELAARPTPAYVQRAGPGATRL